MTNWKHTIDISKPFHAAQKDISIQEAGNQIAAIIRKSPAMNMSDDAADILEDIAERFEDCPDVNEFDYTLNDLYDFGDDHIVWINTLKKS